MSEQAELLDLEVLINAYAVTWLQQASPSFTTREYALLPAESRDTSVTTGTNTTFTIDTTKLSTGLSCSPGILEVPPGWDGARNISNGRGCKYEGLDITGGDSIPNSLLYVGYHGSAYADPGLEDSQCSKNSTHQILIAWSSLRENLVRVAPQHEIDRNLTSLYCETQYWKQRVSATVSADSLEPIDQSVVPLGPREVLTEDEFNSTAFEFILNNGVQPDFRKNTSFIERLDPSWRLPDAHTLLRNRIYPIVGFALGLYDLAVDEYVSEADLTTAFEKAHQLLFSSAIDRIRPKGGILSSETSGSVSSIRYGVSVNRTFAAVVEGLLLLVALLTALLTYVCQTSRSKLISDPGSIDALLKIIRNSTDAKLVFMNKDFADESSLRHGLEDFTFSLDAITEDNGSKLQLTVTKPGESDIAIDYTKLSPTGLGGHYLPAKPMALQAWVGALLIYVLASVIILLSYLKREEVLRGGECIPSHRQAAQLIMNVGLPQPSDRPLVQQILENYIPTAFATLIEPIWVLFNRLLCLTQPFKDLWNQRSKAPRSMASKYAAIPPQLAIWHSLKNKHYVLTLVCSTCLLVNVLAVGLSGLFNEEPVAIDRPMQFRPTYAADITNSTYNMFEGYIKISANAYNDHYFVTLANLSYSTPLPPWLTDEYFFPLVISEELLNSGSNPSTVRTRGFGVAPSCSPLSSYNESILVWRGEGANQDSVVCNTTIPNYPREFGQTGSSFAYEIVAPMSATDTVVDDVGLCLEVLAVGWARGIAGSKTAVNVVNSTGMGCKPVITTREFELVIDGDGRVIHAEALGDASEAFPNSTFAAEVIKEANQRFRYSSQETWHNDTITNDWINYFLQTMDVDDLALVDPSAEVLDLRDMIPKVERVYKRTFAAFLSLTPELFSKYDEDGPTLTGVQAISETRLFMSQIAFIITMTVLAINLVTAILIYWRGNIVFLPRMPSTIGSILGYTAASRIATEDFMGCHRKQEVEKPKFGFGRYIGTDGKAHLGIDVDPYVVPVSLKALKRGDTRAPNSTLERLRRLVRRPAPDKIWL
ncbi:hypothetical protein SLS62_003752 [Diatrype stigma]|uniref:Uncharacterized protein n=1 Tax=Diatrype stigma TaxID=117547 RepID=A0AAN9YU97_9PEZI